MNKKVELGTLLYLVAFVLWLSIALIRYTYFKDFLPTEIISRVLFCAVQLLLLFKLALEFEFKWTQVLGLLVLLVFMTIAWAGGRLQFATMFALIYSAKNVPLTKVLKTALMMQILIFVPTVISSQIGILEDVIWIEPNRQRHGLGFTHCMLASHFGLYMSLIYVALVKKMTWWRALVVLVGNGVLYYYTDGRTDMLLSVIFVAMAFLVGNLAERFRGERVCAMLLAVLPLVLFGLSVLTTSKFGEGHSFLMELNDILNNRLKLGYDAMQTYGFSLWGQKIRWVGASVLHYNPTEVYNYVDNSYLMMSFTYGVIFVFLYCISMGYVLYKKMLQKETMTVVCLLIILAFGIINPQSMYLTYNPFLVLLAMAWNPSQKKEVML